MKERFNKLQKETNRTLENRQKMLNKKNALYD